MSNRPPIVMMQSQTEENAGIKLVIALILMVPLSLWWGLAFSTLWGWFMVPLGAFPLGAAHAAGLGVLLGLVAYSFRSGERSYSEALGMAVMYPGIALLSGWLLTLFI